MMDRSHNTEAPYQNRSSFVSVLAVISIVIAIVQFFSAYSGLEALDSLSAVTQLGISPGMMESLMPSRTSIISEMILALLMITASVMLFKRMKAGRVLYLGVLTAGSIWTVISTVRSYSMMSEYLDLPGVQETSLLMIGATVIVTIGINVVLVWKLTREEVVEEFD